jgi:hypothetical protein
MLSKVNIQDSIFNSSFLYDKLIPENSIYKALHKYGPEFIKDEDFQDLYSLDNGRPSVPPSVLCGTILLQLHEKVSDVEAIERIKFDIRWKYALILPVEYNGFARTNLVNFRVKLLAGEFNRKVFDNLNALGIKLGILKPEDTQAIDSSNIIGRAEVQDTYELLRTSIQKLVKKIRKRGKAKFTKIVKEQRLEKYLQQERKADIDWQNPKERKQVLKELVTDGRSLLKELSEKGAGEDKVISKATELLGKILEQDITEGEEEKAKGKDPEIKKGVAEGRVISTNDTEMRHGRKSKSKKFDGYKVHIAENIEKEWITNVEVTAGNVHDAEPSLALIKEQEKTLGGMPDKILIDGAYGTADNRANFAGEGIDLVSRITQYYDDKIRKENFKIDLENNCVECVAGEITDKYTLIKDDKGRKVKVFTFDKEKCLNCNYRELCTKSKSGRKITLNYNEKYLLEARERQKQPEFEEEFNPRSIIERKFDQLMNKYGLRQARYIGMAKTKLQALFTAVAANLRKLNTIKLNEGVVCLNEG